jgi:hypothetical protein
MWLDAGLWHSLVRIISALRSWQSDLRPQPSSNIVLRLFVSKLQVVMAEVAGVVLGAIPLILYALDHYQNTRETVRSFRNWREELETFGNQIEFQRMALYTTLRNLDIEAKEQITMNQVEVVLQVSHPAQCDLFMRHIRAMNEILDELARDLYPDAQGPVRRTSLYTSAYDTLLLLLACEAASGPVQNLENLLII